MFSALVSPVKNASLRTMATNDKTTTTTVKYREGEEDDDKDKHNAQNVNNHNKALLTGTRATRA